MQPLAQSGDAGAQYILGYLSYNGLGVARNLEVARLWIERAAQQGHKNAITALERIRQSQADKGLISGTLIEQPTTPAPRPEAPPVQIVTPSVPQTRVPQTRVPETHVPETRAPESSPAPQPSAPVEPRADSSAVSGSVSTADDSNAGAMNVTENVTGNVTENAASASDTTTAAPAVTPQTAAWIRAQNPEHYTIQILSGRDKQGMLRSMRYYKLPDPVAYFEYQREDATLYGLIYGSFSGWSAAQAALQQLDPKLRARAPWIRDFKGVQEIMITPPGE